MNKLDRYGLTKILGDRLARRINFLKIEKICRELEAINEIGSDSFKGRDLLYKISCMDLTPLEQAILGYIAGYSDSSTIIKPISIPQIELTYRLLREESSFLKFGPPKNRIVLACNITNYTEKDFSVTIQFPETKVEEIKFMAYPGKEILENRLVPEKWLFLPVYIKITRLDEFWEVTMCNSGEKRDFWEKLRLSFTPDLEIIWQSKFESNS